ncbi:hypothetical protein C8J56DRAFT_865843 [Mycena floridula]|nr:hypothetical protein C8J56DRAFT_867392 [Mycena floridula]KAJ7582398.1 hypothetical protein C8J56DRAFT_865843 [Mycena floridula]
MTDRQKSPSPSSPKVRHRESPPPSPPSPNIGDPDVKLSRKREREVSAEPLTTPKAVLDADPSLVREARTPAKKNRLNLGSTAEEDDINGSRSRSNSGSPPISVSPPVEMKIKVRQISRGVEDLSWQNMNQSDPQPEPEVHPDLVEDKEEDLQPSSASLDPEKGLKRTFLQRGTSEGPPDSSKAASEPMKRARDDANTDDNPREAKRPSPPPEASANAAKSGGFMAYASTSSPFASVKGQNIFSSRKSPSPGPSTALLGSKTSLPKTSSSFTSTHASSSSSTPAKRSGFEAFASASSPFATRAKSPVLGSGSKWGKSKAPSSRNANPVNAFSAYTGASAQGFSLPLQKRARAASPAGSEGQNSTVGALNGVDSGAEEDEEERHTTFGEKLRAAKDDQEETQSEDERPKIVLTEQEMTTGEEEEETIHQVRGKLYSLADGAWKERGTGLLKLNVRASDGAGARLVMRKEAVHSLLLNVTLFKGMRCDLAQDPRYVRISVIEAGSSIHYNLRFANAKIAQELVEEIKGNLP